MSHDLLLAHFDAIADAPGGIARLRQLILQLAVQGRLVEQNPADESASVLLERIRAEKIRLAQQGLTSKARLTTDILPIELSFEIPASWTWARLAEVGHDWGQKTPDAPFTYIDVSAIDNERGVISSEVAVLQPSDAPSRARKLVRSGTLIYSTVRPYLLNIAIVDRDFTPEPIVSTAFAIIHPLEGIHNRYLYYYLRSQTFIDYVALQMKGVAYPAINDGQFFAGLVPLPPTAEQRRIVERVDALMALCDALEARQAQRGAERQRLLGALVDGLLAAGDAGEAAAAWARLSTSFDLLLAAPEDVAPLRQAVLQLAVQGRLVEQEAGDEPASALLERIRAEKARRAGAAKQPPRRHAERSEASALSTAQTLRFAQGDSAASPAPFAVPQGWEWAYFSDVAIIASNLVQPHQFSEMPHIAPDNIEKQTGRLLEYHTIAEDGVTSAKHRFFSGQILYSKIRPNLSKVVIVDFDGLCSADMYPINARIDILFLWEFMLSLTFLSQSVKNDTRVAMPKINQEELNKILVPVPPLAEQRRIVARVEQLMALCDGLEARLREERAAAERLSAALCAAVADASVSSAVSQ